MNTPGGLAATSYDEQQKIWSGIRRKDLFGPDVTLGEASHFVLSCLHPDKVVQIDDLSGDEVTAAQLLRESKILAKNLLDLMGLKQGDVIGISTGNTRYLCSLVLGAFLCGTPTNAVYPEFDKKTIKTVFKLSQPKVFFCDVSSSDVVREAVRELNLNGDIFLMDEGGKEGFRNLEELLVDDGHPVDLKSLPCSRMKGDDTAAIICSSGTTGPPKGVLCSHRALLNLTIMSDLQSDSVIFSFSNMYWISAMLAITSALLSGTKRVITTQPFSAEYFQHLVEKHRITNVIAAVHQMAQVLASATPSTGQRLSSIRTILCGGSLVPKVLSEGLNRIFADESHRAGLMVAYGMTELAGMVSQNDVGPGKRREGSVGQLMPNVEVRIVNKQTGELLGLTGGEGEIHIRTPYKWSGYYRNPEANRQTYIDGWLVSGDLGYFDADGFLYIVGREKDVFKCNGFQIFPGLIEEVVLQLKGVSEVCVVGIPNLMANDLTACAVVRTDDDYGRSITAQQVEDYVAKNMTSIFHIRAGVYFLEAFPKTSSDKILRRKVLDMVQELYNINK